MNAYSRVAVVGAGAFGTALAIVAERAGRRATLIARDPAQARTMAAERQNSRHLPGVRLPDSIFVTSDPAEVAHADMLILAAPAQTTRDAIAGIATNVPPGIPVIAAAKGIEQRSRRMQSGLIAELLPGRPSAALSGPGFADEIARGMPTAVTIAAEDMRLARALAAALATDTFRPYASDDLVGVELGGAVKNVLAIAAGIVVGHALGESARAALIARGLAEMMRLGTALGARPETFMGLSGLGDLVLTATSTHSRNFRFGVALGEGRKAAELLSPGQPLAEGAHTAAIAAALARDHGVEMPITDAVAAIVSEQLGVEAAVASLLSRPLARESH